MTVDVALARLLGCRLVSTLAGARTRCCTASTPPEPQANANFGFYISVFGDANRDGKLDIAIGTDAQDVPATPIRGRRGIFSGRGGTLLYALDSPDPQADARFGSRIGAAGDGIGDVIVGASNHDFPAGCAEGSRYGNGFPVRPARGRAGAGSSAGPTARSSARWTTRRRRRAASSAGR